MFVQGPKFGNPSYLHLTASKAWSWDMRCRQQLSLISRLDKDIPCENYVCLSPKTEKTMKRTYIFITTTCPNMTQEDTCVLKPLSPFSFLTFISFLHSFNMRSSLLVIVLPLVGTIPRGPPGERDTMTTVSKRGWSGHDVWDGNSI